MKKIIEFLKSLFTVSQYDNVSVEEYVKVKEEITAVSEAQASASVVEEKPKKKTSSKKKPATKKKKDGSK